MFRVKHSFFKKMKLTKKDLKKIAIYVRKFNASISRLEKKMPEQANLLPERYNVSVIKNMGSRKALNRFYKDVDLWFKPKNRELVSIEGFKISRWQKRILERSAQKINKKRDEIKDKINKRGDIDILKPVDIVQRAKDIKAEVKKGNIDSGANSWFNFLKRTIKLGQEGEIEKRFAQYRENYINSLDVNLSKGNAEKIKRLIKDMSNYDLFLMTQYDDLTSIDFIYGPEQEEEIAEKMESHIIKYLENMEDS